MDLEKTLSYTFHYDSFLKEALVHKSYHHENPEECPYHNERLEFLGDTVLGLVIAELLFSITPPLPESEMSKIKSYLVSGRTLSIIAKQIDLGSHILLGKGELESGGREKQSILANTIESIFGAVFMDGGFEAAKDFILRVYDPVIQEALDEEKYLDYKTELQEICQRDYGKLPEYRVINEEGLEHEKTFYVEASIQGNLLGMGIGTSKKKAEINAARDAFFKMKTNTANHSKDQ